MRNKEKFKNNNRAAELRVMMLRIKTPCLLGND